jgi:ABC-type multidrug transport system fused ATPase/permease subunit
MTYLLFMSYVTMGGEMSIKTIYAGLAILNIIRLPMSVFPLARTAAAEATKALTRLRSFLLLPEMNVPSTGQEGDNEEGEERSHGKESLNPFHRANRMSSDGRGEDDCLVNIDDATFQWTDGDSSGTGISTMSPTEAVGQGGNGKGYGKLSVSAGGLKSTTSEKGKEKKEIEMRSKNEVSSGYALQNVSVKIFKGELVAIVGSVGSGKTSLISAILQQIHRVKGSQYLRGKVAYVSQDHWIQNKSVRDNVLFFTDIDEERYMDTMDASQLSRDLVMLPSADHTEIGERGINLSGGQKARVNIARAIYTSDADLYLMDDPLAAVDVHVGRAVFEDALLRQLQNKARVVVLSSSYHLLPRFDKVLVVSGMGTVDVYTDIELLCLAHPQYRLAAEESHGDVGGNADGVVRNGVNGEETKAEHVDGDVDALGDIGKTDSVYRKRQRSIEEKQEAGKTSLIGEEDRERGSVSFATFHKYYSVALQNRNGTLVFVSILVLFAIAQGFRVLCDLWVGIWGKDAERHNSQHTESYYMIMFTIFLTVTCVFVVTRSAYFLSTCLSASSNLHKHILSSVLSAPVNTYFDVTPIGRVLNRFTKDLDSVDSLLPDFFLTALQSGFHVISVLLLCTVSTPYFIIVLIPLAATFYLIQEHFRKTSRELKRLDGVSRSPIYNHFGELLAGLSTIRAYGKQAIFLKNHHALCDVNKKCFFAFNVTNRWLALRLDLISTLVVLSVGLIAVLVVDFGSNVDHNILGLALVYSIQLSGILQWTVRTVIETENSMTSVERLLAFNKIDAESKRGDDVPGGMDEAWPREGSVEIKHLSLRYREGLPLVLDGVNLSVPGGYKVGICGRTGAGMLSSHIPSLSRLVLIIMVCACLSL